MLLFSAFQEVLHFFEIQMANPIQLVRIWSSPTLYRTYPGELYSPRSGISAARQDFFDGRLLFKLARWKVLQLMKQAGASGILTLGMKLCIPKLRFTSPIGRMMEPKAKLESSGKECWICVEKIWKMAKKWLGIEPPCIIDDWKWVPCAIRMSTWR